MTRKNGPLQLKEDACECEYSDSGATERAEAARETDENNTEGALEGALARS